MLFGTPQLALAAVTILVTCTGMTLAIASSEVALPVLIVLLVVLPDGNPFVEAVRPHWVHAVALQSRQFELSKCSRNAEPLWKECGFSVPNRSKVLVVGSAAGPSPRIIRIPKPSFDSSPAFRIECTVSAC